MVRNYRCERCKRTIEPRGGVAPRFCPVCGQNLTRQNGLLPTDRIWYNSKPPGTAVAALVLGLLSLFIPYVGLLLGAMALGFGFSAKDTIRKSDMPREGTGLATTGIILGVVGCLLQLLICLGSA
ncbi:MAG: DUF4190 domain-containing protein [Planctomycetota bacterium]